MKNTALGGVPRAASEKTVRSTGTRTFETDGVMQTLIRLVSERKIRLRCFSMNLIKCALDMSSESI